MEIFLLKESLYDNGKEQSFETNISIVFIDTENLIVKEFLSKFNMCVE